MALDQALLAIDRACGSDSVVTDLDLRRGYSRDESEVTPVIPEAVVRARSTDDVVAILTAANRFGIPITPRSGGTGRVGGAVPVAGGLVLSLEGMDEIKEIDGDNLRAIAGPGVITSQLHQAVEAENLFYAPDPNSLDSCRLGGNVAANAGGPRAFKYGVTRNWVLGLEVVTAEGQMLRVGKPTAKGVTGYDIAGLIVGSEGTLAVVTEVTVRLVPKPESVRTLLVFLPDEGTLGKAISATIRRRVLPRCLEFLDALALDIVRPQAGLHVPTGAGAMLICELDGDADRLDAEAETCGNAMIEAGAIEVLVATNESERAGLWAGRREMSHAMRRQANHKLSEDVVVPRTRIGQLLQTCRGLSERHELRIPTYGHAGDGNLHVNFLWDEPDQRPAVKAAIRSLFEDVIGLDGTLSGEHGIGVLKAPYLGIEQSDELISLQQRIKDVFDPKGILNPGKIFPAAAKKFHGAC